MSGEPSIFFNLIYLHCQTIYHLTNAPFLTVNKAIQWWGPKRLQTCGLLNVGVKYLICDIISSLKYLICGLGWDDKFIFSEGISSRNANSRQCWSSLNWPQLDKAMEWWWKPNQRQAHNQQYYLFHHLHVYHLIFWVNLIFCCYEIILVKSYFSVSVCGIQYNFFIIN